MNITTTEDLLRVPEGTTITLNRPNGGGRTQWTRSGESLRRNDGITLAPGLFLGALNAGLVEIPDDVALLTEGESLGEALVENAVAQSVTVAPDPAALEQARQAGITEGMWRVHAALAEAWDHQSFMPAEINEVMEGLGLDPMPAPLTTVSVDVEVEGESELDYVDVERMIEPNRRVDVADNVSVDWTWEYTEDIEEIPEGQCACDNIDRDKVESDLEAAGISYNTFNFSVSCENCR